VRYDIERVKRRLVAAVLNTRNTPWRSSVRLSCGHVKLQPQYRMSIGQTAYCRECARLEGE
jgi:hypothetical protein